MKVRTITALHDFDALAPLWREVTAASMQTSPFASHDWFACCWRSAGPNRQREVLMLEDSAGPVAFMPLVRTLRTLRGLPVRALDFLAAPDTPFAEFPVARGVEGALGMVLAILRERRDWDILSLDKLPVDSLLLKALEGNLLEQGFRVERSAGPSSPYLEVAGDFETFFRDKSQRFRKTYRNIENRMCRQGKATIEEHTVVDPDGPVFAEVVDVSLLSWKASRGVAIATMPGMPRFFRELTARASLNGWLHLWILRLDGRAVATEYQIGADGRLHALRADFDASLSEVSPGGYLNLQIIRALFSRPGLREYDMGPGTNDYKLRWASGVRETVTLAVFAPTLYGRTLHAIEARLVPAARRWRSA